MIISTEIYLKSLCMSLIVKLCLSFELLLKSNFISFELIISCEPMCGSRKFSQGDHLQTRGGPANFTIAQIHILENRGAETPNTPPLDPPMEPSQEEMSSEFP